MFNEDSGTYCSDCAFWIVENSVLTCEKCKCPVCERCGTLDDDSDLYMCFDCFNIPIRDNK